MRVGYAAFFDVLGFSALVASDQGDRIGVYLERLKEVFDNDRPSPVDYIVFSDSIILTTPDDDPAALQALLARCSTLLYVMLASEIPLRGAIARGSYITEKTSHGTFVAGRAIVEAYRFESVQDWIGVMLAPSVIQAVPDLEARCLFQYPNTLEIWRSLSQRLLWAAFVQPCLQIPFHSASGSSGNYFGFAIVPSSGETTPMALRDSIGSAMERLRWLSSIAPNPQAQAKYHRTSLWLSEIRLQWHSAAARLETNPAWLESSGPAGSRS